MRAISRPVAASHTRAMLTTVETIHLPSGLIANESLPPLSAIFDTSCPVDTSHTLTALSLSLKTSHFPSELNLMEYVEILLLRVTRVTSLPVFTSHILIMPSSPAEATKSPFGLN